MKKCINIVRHAHSLSPQECIRINKRTVMQNENIEPTLFSSTDNALGNTESCILKQTKEANKLWTHVRTIDRDRNTLLLYLPVSVIHGWDDELIPAQAVTDWAHARRARLLLVNDGHRLSDHVAASADAFGQLLAAL